MIDIMKESIPSGLAYDGRQLEAIKQLPNEGNVFRYIMYDGTSKYLAKYIQIDKYSDTLFSNLPQLPIIGIEFARFSSDSRFLVIYEKYYPFLDSVKFDYNKLIDVTKNLMILLEKLQRTGVSIKSLGMNNIVMLESGELALSGVEKRVEYSIESQLSICTIIENLWSNVYRSKTVKILINTLRVTTIINIEEINKKYINRIVRLEDFENKKMERLKTNPYISSSDNVDVLAVIRGLVSEYIADLYKLDTRILEKYSI